MYMTNNNNIIKSLENHANSENLLDSNIKYKPSCRTAESLTYWEKLMKESVKYTCNKIRFTMVTNPFKMVKDPDLIGNSEVYETKYEKLADAMQTTFLVKMTKRGEPMRVHTTDIPRPKEHQFQSLMNIFSRYSMFPLVECGKSSMRKDLFTVDIDERIDVKTFFDKLKAAKDIPECVCTRHISTGHWQIQFYLKSPVMVKYIDLKEQNSNGKYIPTVKRNEDNHLVYSRTLKRLARYFKDIYSGTDLYYQGTLCRNPYSDSQESYLFINNTYVSLREKKPTGNELADYIRFLDKNNIVLRKNINLEIHDIDEKNPELSRHKLTMIYAREWVWQNMRNGCTPTESSLENYLLSVKMEIADKCLKEPHSDKEIISQVHSLYAWSVDNYKDIDTTSGQWKSSIYWNRNQRSEKIKQAKRLKKRFVELVSQDYSISEIAKIFGMSRVTLYSYMAIFMVMDTVKTVTWFKNSAMKFGGYRPWEEIIAEISDKIKLMKMRFGESKIKWKWMDYSRVAEEYGHAVNYDIPLAGNHELETRYIA